MFSNVETGTTTPQPRSVHAVLRREKPGRFVFAPNFWQWFTHHRNHGLLPEEVRDCGSQLELINHLGLDVFSRNLYCDPTQYWFGGLAQEDCKGVDVEIRRTTEGRDIITERTYHTRAGDLTERLRFIFNESTLVQEKFLLEDFANEREAFGELVRNRRWRFDSGKFETWNCRVGEKGILVAGELFSPLKLLHLAAGPANSVYLLEDSPEICKEWLEAHEAAQLDLVTQMARSGVPAMMAMDNLDSAFHSPRYVERWSARFYEQAGRLCREAGSSFWIHACGQQKALLPLIASLGVDGLEGVAYPPLGNVALDEALRLTGERLIITGGVSAMETERFETEIEVRTYLENLFNRLRPYAHRFMLSASCNTSIRTRWRVIKWFRDAWRDLR